MTGLVVVYNNQSKDNKMLDYEIPNDMKLSHDK